MPDLEEPFNYGFDAYERLCEWGGTPDEFPFRKASHSDDYLDLSLSHARFQFLLPDPPDLSSIPEGTGGEELFELEAAIYEDWTVNNSNSCRLHRMKLEFGFTPVEDYQEDLVFPFTPLDLQSVIGFMKWI